MAFNKLSCLLWMQNNILPNVLNISGHTGPLGYWHWRPWTGPYWWRLVLPSKDPIKSVHLHESSEASQCSSVVRLSASSARCMMRDVSIKHIYRSTVPCKKLDRMFLDNISLNTQCRAPKPSPVGYTEWPTLWEIWNEQGGGQPPEWGSKQFAPDLKRTQEGKLSTSTFKRNLHPQRAYWFWECRGQFHTLWIIH